MSSIPIPSAFKYATNFDLKKGHEDQKITFAVNKSGAPSISDDNGVSLVFTMTKGTGAVVLNNRNGRFRFGLPGAPFLSAQKAIEQAMYFAL